MNNEEKILSMLGGMQTHIETLVSEQQKTNQRLDNLEQGQAGLIQEVQEVKTIQIRMEHEHGEKLTALFDGYKLLFDAMGEVRANVHSIKTTQEKHSLEIKWLDSQKKNEPFVNPLPAGGR